VKALVLSSVAAALLLDASVAQAAGDPERGRTLFALAGGCGCHTADAGPVGAGGREIATPFGTFFGSNITPDSETGIGRWTDEQIIAAIRDGDTPRGVAAPAMPYYMYAGMSDRDVADLVAYLRALPPVRREVRDAEVRFPFPRLAYRAWRGLFAPSIRPPATPPSDEIARGRYWVEHVSICGDCHTPRGRLGEPIEKMHLAGVAKGPDDETVPNITSDRETGIGDWDEGDIVALLHTGMKPDFDNVQGLMAEVVDGRDGGPGYRDVPEAELRAIARFLKTVPAVRNEVEAE
jgi:mono/diheme cytochrome c family protein